MDKKMQGALFLSINDKQIQNSTSDLVCHGNWLCENWETISLLSQFWIMMSKYSPIPLHFKLCTTAFTKERRASLNLWKQQWRKNISWNTWSLYKYLYFTCLPCNDCPAFCFYLVTCKMEAFDIFLHHMGVLRVIPGHHCLCCLDSERCFKKEHGMLISWFRHQD